MKRKSFLALAMAASMFMTSIGITAFAQNTETTEPVAEMTQEEKVRPTMSPQRLQAMDEVRMEQEINESYVESASVLDEEAELSAETVTLSGTVSLPSGVTSKTSGRIGVYLYEMEKDGNKVLLTGNSSVASTYIEVAKGKSSGTYSVTVPKGSYAIGVRYYLGMADVVGAIAYYRSDGVTCEKNLADAVELTSSKKINITIPKAERTISGTVSFTEAVPEDTYFYVYAYGNNSDISNAYINIPVSAGAKTLDYSVGVGEGIYELNFSLGDDDSMYYSVYGDLREWEDICYLNTTEKSITGLDFEYEVKDAEAIISTNKSLDVNFKLPETVEETKKYGFFYQRINATNPSIYSANYILPGESGFTRRVSLPTTQQIYVGVFDRTYAGDVSNEGLKYYYSEQFGVTTDKSVATPISVADIDSIDITFPDSYELTGTVSRNGMAEGAQLDLFVFAEAENERFFTKVKMAADKDSADYKIYIPKWAEGMELSVYSALRTVDMDMEVSAQSVPVSVIASADMSKTNISAPPSDIMKKVSGTVSFGAPAPEGGVALTLRYYNMGERYSNAIDALTYIIEEGKSSYDYSFYVPVCDSTLDQEKVRIGIYTEATGTVFDHSSTKRLTTEELGDYDISVPYAEQTVSGKIILPDDIELTSGMTVEMYVEYNYNGSVYTKYAYASIIKGEKSTTYSVNVPSGGTLTRIWMYSMTTGTLPVNADNVHYSQDGATDDYAELSIPLTNGYSNADFNLEKCNMIIGNIIVPDDFEGAVSCSISTYGGNSYLYIDEPGIYPYSVTVPDEAETTTLEFYFREQETTNYYTGRLYYTSNGLVANYDQAENISVGSGIVTVADVEMIQGTVLTGEISFEEGAFIDGEINIEVEIYNDEIRSRKNYSVDTTESFIYSVGVPQSEDSNVTLTVSVYNYSDAKSNVPTGTYYYAGVPRVKTDRWSAVKIDVSQGAEQDLIIPVGKKVSGKFILPEGAKGTLESASLWFEGKASDMSATAYPDETGYYEIYVLPDDYWYSISTYPNNISGMTNIKQQTYYYVDATQSTTNYDDRGGEDLTNGAENINFYLEIGKCVSGKVTLPDGITGNGGMYIMVEDAKSMQESSHYVCVEGDTEFMITPTYMTDEPVIISYYIYGIDGVYDGTLYYTSSGPTLDESEAEFVSAGESGIENIELKALNSKGTITLKPKRMNCGDMGYLYADGFIVCDNGYEQRKTLYINEYETTGNERKYSLPQTEELATAKTFNVAVEVDSVRWYLTENGSYTKNIEQAFDFEIKSQSIDVPIPDKSINYPDDMKNGNLYFAVTSAEADTKSNLILVQSTLSANNLYYGDVMPGAYIGVYDGDRLVRVLTGEYYITSTLTPYNANFDQQYQLELCISTDIDENCTYKLLTWNNLVNATPLANALEITIQ